MFPPRIDAEPDDSADVNDLDETLHLERQAGDTECQAVGREFVVDNDEAANWLVRCVKIERDYVNRVEQWAAVEVRRARRREEYLLQRYGAQAEGWLRRRLEDERGRRRSISLPAGIIGLRATPAKVVITESAALLAWVKANLVDALQVQICAAGVGGRQLAAWQAEHELAAKVDESVSKRLINAYVADTGDVPDGTAIESAHDQLTFK